MDSDLILKETKEAMNKAVEYMIHEFASVRTGKASPSLVEGIDIQVAAYGSSMKLKQLAMITTPEPRTIMIQPFDPSTTQDIEKGLAESKLGINPAVDGKNIRLPIPELSEERRVDLVKVIKQIAEDARVRVRASRRDGIDKVKDSKKSGDITEDDLHRLEKEVQTLTDKYVKSVDDHVKSKETEIMTV
jgi:ribosome recycling factor